MSNLQEVNTDNFDTEVLKSDKPVMVDFYADWCGPCKALAPVMEQIAEETKDRYKVVKLNVDSSPEIAAKYNVKGIPCLIVFRDGKDVKRRMGGGMKETIVGMME